MDHRVCLALVVVLMLGAGCSAQAMTATECDVAPKARINCGYPGISKSICEGKGCCFDSSISGVIWCFRPELVEECAL